MSMMTLAEGSIFAGRYKIVRSIATGGMGAVYEVVHNDTARRRALKVMHPHLVQSDDLRNRFQAEARIAGHVESKYIVDVFDAGIDEVTKMPFLVMELLKGEELGKRLKRAGRFGFEETVGYLWQTALALDRTHKANIVHRDLKPENLFLCEDEDGSSTVKVLDFGIAKLMLEGGTQANVTRALGTPLFMAPEQFKSKSKVSPATDIHALAMMAYSMLVGAPYWADEQANEDNAFAFAVLIMQGPPEPPTVRALRKGMQLPAAFDEWFGQATSPNPEQRFFKATVAIKGLAEALGVVIPGAVKDSNPGSTISSASSGHQTPVGQTDSSRTKSGQIDSGKTNPGQTSTTKAGQSGLQEAKPAQGTSTGPTAASSSGPQGTVVLDSTPPPANVGTNPSAYGLSSSQPKVVAEPFFDAPAAVEASAELAVRLAKAKKRRLLTSLGLGLGIGMFVLAIGVVALALSGRHATTTQSVASLPSALPSASDMNAVSSSMVATAENTNVSASASMIIPAAIPSAAASAEALDFVFEAELDAGSDAADPTKIVGGNGGLSGPLGVGSSSAVGVAGKPVGLGAFPRPNGTSMGKPRPKNVFERGGRQ